jgi:hypothetical protein
MDNIEDDVSYNSSNVACVLAAAITFLLNRCLAMIGVYIYIYIYSQSDGRDL